MQFAQRLSSVPAPDQTLLRTRIRRALFSLANCPAAKFDLQAPTELMEPSDTWFTYWWVVVPVVAVLYFVYVALTRGSSRPGQLAFISLVLGVVGLLFSPLAPFAIILGRKAAAAVPPDKTITIVSRIAIVLGVIGCAILAFAFLIAGIYLFGYLTNQYP